MFSRGIEKDQWHEIGSGKRICLLGAVAKQSTYEKLALYKSYVLLKWNYHKDTFKLPIVELYVYVSKAREDIHIYTTNTDVINITNLEPFSTYHICFAPLTLRSSRNSCKICDRKDPFTTAEGGLFLHFGFVFKPCLLFPPEKT